MMKKIALTCFLSVFMLHFYAQSYSFRVDSSGNGADAILFLPGFASHGDVWKPTARALHLKGKKYFFTMPGFAGVKADSKVAFDSWIKELEGFAKNHSWNKVVIVGHSMGGGMALTLAARLPELLDKVVIVEALPFLAGLRNPMAQGGAIECEAMQERLMAMPREAFRKQQEQTVASMVQDTSYRNRVLQWSMLSDRGTFARVYCDFLNQDLRPLLPKIEAEVLVVMQPSFKLQETAVREQYKSLESYRLQFAPQGLHFLMYDAAQWFRQQLQSFISHP